MDIKREIENIINEESMNQRTKRATALQAKLQSLKTDGRRACDAKMPELRGDCYADIAKKIKKAEIALHNLSGP